MATKMMNLFFVVLIVGFERSTAQMVPAVFIFGDSLVDVGNNNNLPISFFKANIPHNGVDFPNKIATGRFSNGKNIADFIAEKVGLPTSLPYRSLPSKNVTAFMNGVNFASGGAGIFNITYHMPGACYPLTQQVEDYEAVHREMVQKLGASAVQNLVSKSLFGIVIGSNDIFGYSNLLDSSKGTSQQYVDFMSATLKQLIMRIYNKGGRRFLVVGLGPLGCSPMKRNKEEPGAPCDEQASSMAASFNANLQTMLHDLSLELNGFSYSFFDFYSSSLHIIQNPSSYGFTEAKEACCGLGKIRGKASCTPMAKLCSNRSSHFFWDMAHPSEASAKIIVDYLFDGPPQYSTPFNLKKLITP